jgi:hypothetical protein
MKRHIITAVDTSDTCDGKARVIKSCASYDEAKDFVRHDMETYLTANSNLDIITDWNKMSAWTEDGTIGCEWNIEEVDIMPIDTKKVRAAENVLIDNGIDADEADTVLQAIGYTLLDMELYPED